MHRPLTFVVMLLLLAASTSGQEKYPPETKNAALRYWLAFADLQDFSADKPTQDLLEKTVTGDAAWDEARLGAILDQNQTAILVMQRASRLPECDWGLEYSNGPTASIGYAGRARALARLNTLYGIRLASSGAMDRAVDAWLAGVRFSQQLAQGGPLIFTLIGKSALMPNLKALTRVAQAGSLSASQRNRVKSAITALPESGFDWAEAMRIEEAGLDLALDRIASASDPAKAYEALAGTAPPAGFTVPNLADRQRFHKLMLQVEQVLREPPGQGAAKLDVLERQARQSAWFFQQTTPSFTKSNEARSQIAAARHELLLALESH